MLDQGTLKVQLEKLARSKAAYQKNLADAQEAASRIQDELKRHDGAIWILEQLLAHASDPVAVEGQP